MERTLGRREASDAVSDLGWRFLLGTLRTSVAVRSLARAAEVAAQAVAVCGDDADGHLRVDLRSDQASNTPPLSTSLSAWGETTRRASKPSSA